MKMYIAPIILALLLAAPLGAKEIEVENLAIRAGTSEKAARYTPWSGSWFPQTSAELSKGWNGTQCFRYDSSTKKYVLKDGIEDNDASPFVKYDRYVQRRHGSNPGAALMELHGTGDFHHHVYGDRKEEFDSDGVDYSWWGHCNGWAAASILEKEPLTSIIAQGIRFEVADLKGILAESFFGCKSDFTGSRYNKPRTETTGHKNKAHTLLDKIGADDEPDKTEYIDWYEAAYSTTLKQSTKDWVKPHHFKNVLQHYIDWYTENYDDALADIHPDAFHRILTTVIGQKRMALVFDITATEAVWNYPAFKYNSRITRSGSKEIDGVSRRKYTVRTIVTYGDDGVSESIIGINTFTKTYTYELYTDDSDKIVGGIWTGSSKTEHPDFAWLPISNGMGAESSENPKLEYRKVLELLTSDHSTKTDSEIEIQVSSNGSWVGSNSRIADSKTTTWSRPITGINGAISVRVRQAGSASIAKVVYAQQPVSSITSNVKATRADVVELASITSSPWAATLTFSSNGKKMLVAQAYDASGKLISADELTLRVNSAPVVDPVTDPAPLSGEDRYEQNDSRSTAATLSAGTYELGCFDADYFKIATLPGQKLTVKIAFKHSDGDLDMKLTDASGSGLDSSTSTSNSETVSATASVAGDLIVHVYGYRSATAPYKLTVTLSDAPSASEDDSYEENDSRSKSVQIDRGTISGLQARDQDWFKVSVRPDERVVVKIAFPHSSGDLDMKIYNSRGKVLAKATSVSDDETIELTVPSTGVRKIYIKVYGYRDATNDYTLSVD